MHILNKQTILTNNTPFNDNALTEQKDVPTGNNKQPLDLDKKKTTSRVEYFIGSVTELPAQIAFEPPPLTFVLEEEEPKRKEHFDQ